MSAYYVVMAIDKPGMRSTRERIRPAHRDYLRTGNHGVRVRLGGPLLEDDGVSMNGTLLVIEADSQTEVEHFLKNDPYMHADLFAQVQIRPWNWSLGNPGREAGQ